MIKEKKLQEGDICTDCYNGKMVRETYTIVDHKYSLLICDGLIDPNNPNKPLETCYNFEEIE